MHLLDGNPIIFLIPVAYCKESDHLLTVRRNPQFPCMLHIPHIWFCRVKWVQIGPQWAYNAVRPFWEKCYPGTFIVGPLCRSIWGGAANILPLTEYCGEREDHVAWRKLGLDNCIRNFPGSVPLRIQELPIGFGRSWKLTNEMGPA